jgi:hypothetical protein
MTGQTVYRRPVFRKGAPPVRRRRRLLNRSFDEGDRLYPTRDGRHLSDTLGRRHRHRVQGAIA